MVERKEIDLNAVFYNPILPKPPCFAHPDGPLRIRKKASVLHLMKRGINSHIPGDVNVVIADGVSVIQTSVKDKTQTSAVVDTNQEEMRILKKHFTLGPCQRIASDFNELLKTSFKCQLLHFL